MQQFKLIFVICLLGFSNLIWSQEKPKVIATINITADIAQNIGGEYFDISSLVPIGGDPHLYEPIPQDAQNVSKAQLILKNGLTLEGWLTEFINNSGTKALIVTVSDGISSLKSLTYENASDPHAWMSASNGILYAENIKNAFATLLPEHTAVFEANFEKYKAKLSELNKYITTEIQKIPESKRVLITSHDAFQYYGKQYGIELEAILGTSTDAEAQTSDYQRVYGVIKDKEIPAVFVESTINPKMLEQIAKDTKAQVGGKLYADSLGEPDGDADTYLKMLRTNTDVIVNGLTKVIETPIEENETQNNLIFYIILGVLFIGGFLFMYRKMSA